MSHSHFNPALFARSLAICAFLLVPTIRAASPLDHWTRQQPTGPAGTNEIAFANGKFFMAGYPINSPLTDGSPQVLHTSEDAKIWTRQPATWDYSQSVSLMKPFGNDLFIGFSNGTAEWLRADGSREFVAAPVRNVWMDIERHNGEFFGTLGTSGVTNFFRSVDGLNWTKTAGPMSAYKLASGAGHLVVTGSKGKVARSTDGTQWVEFETGVTNMLYSLTFANGLFVAGGPNEVLRSSDGAQWARVAIPIGTIGDMKYGDGKFLAVGSSGAASSSDGVNWNVSNIPRGGDFRTRGAYGNGMWIIRGTMSWSFVSRDAIAWERLENFDAACRELIVWKDKVFAAAGRIYTSADGKNWQPPQKFASGLNLACNDTTIVSVTPTSRPAYSTDGVNWTNVTGRGMRSVAYGNGQFIGVVERPDDIAGIQTTPDGIVWSDGLSPVTTRPLSITFGAGRFVVGGVAGLIVTSPDGVTWTPQNSGVTNDISSLSFARDLFIATGSAGLIVTSTDGVNWTQRDSHTTKTLAKAAYGHGAFVLVGDGGAVLTSPDGSTWTAPTFICPEPLYCVASVRDRFVVGGDYGAVFTSAYFGPSRFECASGGSNAPLRMTLLGQIGVSQQLQTRNSLGEGDWTNFATFEQTNEVQQVQIPQTADQTFVRVISQ
jgi:hypothetical protein